MLSIEPSPTSLHAEYKLWSEMNPVEQDEALDMVGEYLKKYGKLLGTREGTSPTTIKHGTCEILEF